MCYSNYRYCKEYGRLRLAFTISALLSDLLSMLTYYLAPYDQLIFWHFRQNIPKSFLSC